MIETQIGLILEIESDLKKALKKFFSTIPDWYNQRISERTRGLYEQRNRRKQGFSDNIKNQNLVIIDDFTLNELQFIFGDRDHPDLVGIVFGETINVDILFSKIKFIKDCRNPLSHASTDGPKSISPENEYLLRTDCTWIHNCITKYLSD